MEGGEVELVDMGTAPNAAPDLSSDEDDPGAAGSRREANRWRRLCADQRDEIALLQRWLAGQQVVGQGSGRASETHAGVWT